MTRAVLASDKISASAMKTIEGYHAQVVEQVRSAVEQNTVVVVGMAHNPYVKKARKALEQKGVRFTYLQYGNYLKGWKQRLAIKLWSGWPTYPQVFVEGKLVGGYQETAQWLAQQN